MFSLKKYLLVLLVMLLSKTVALASEVTIPNSFTGGTRALATQVNANFSAVATGVNDNNSRIAALEMALATLQSDLATANSTISTMQNQLSAINTSNIMALEPYVSVDTLNDARGPLVRFSGVNVQIVNGAGQTNTINGLGNLIVGYDEVRTGGEFVCSFGNFDESQSLCESTGRVWAINHKTGSHNIVGGIENSYSSYGGLVIGKWNAINNELSSVSGGNANVASGAYSSVSGGVYNVANSASSSISGGGENRASGAVSSICGGSNNVASGLRSSVSGGDSNIASGSTSSIGGGNRNSASGPISNISGGFANTASGARSSISGGSQNVASGQFSSVCGGGGGSSTEGNTAAHNFSSILGGQGQTTITELQTIPALP